MRARVTFDVHGSTLVEVERRAYEKLAEFIESDPDDAKFKSDIEIDIEEVQDEIPIVTTYVGHVFARIRQ